ncbi:MAG TPA: ATP-binding protein [Yinghuangia sp.]|nr:ATP-binding protein [Yinghuangia sp.]
MASVPSQAKHGGPRATSGRGPAGTAVVLTLHLPGSVDAVPRARHALRDTVAAGGGGADECLQILELLVSELVTNAVRHAPQSTEVTVQLLRGESTFRLAVTDAGGPLRRPGRQARTCDENGRGLLLVEALAQSWGSYPVAGGKVVWCDVPTL